MRLKDAQIPIFLWLSAAGLLHLAGADGGERLAVIYEGKSKLRVAARDLAAPITIASSDDDEVPAPELDEPKITELDAPVPSASTSAMVEKPVPPVPTVVAKKDVKKPDSEPTRPAPKPEPEKKAVIPPLVPMPSTAAPPPRPEKEKKIAVVDPRKKDDGANPDAKFLAEKNHKVRPLDETTATITSLTENHPDPTPGTHAGPPTEKPGDADKTAIAHDDDRKGAKVAPNVVPKSAGVDADPSGRKNPDEKSGSSKGDDRRKSDSPNPGIKIAAKPTETGTGATAKIGGAAPSELTGDGPGAAKPATSAGPRIGAGTGDASKSGDGKPKDLPTIPGVSKSPKWVTGLGFGAKGVEGKPSISIDERVAKAAIGMDELDRLKKVDGETRMSKHRGAWKSASLERWRAAIENYVPGVKPGKTTNLGTAASPWATYLHQIHIRLHPIFADGFVDSLSDLPPTHPLNDKTLITRMEIVIAPDGAIHKLGIVKHSGVTMFDLAALDSVDRSGPFGKPPDAIISPDGFAYLHWEFHRDDMRCSNANAYPFMLSGDATEKPKKPLEPPKPEDKEPKPPPDEVKL